jgi:hypothetical protein
LESKKWIWNVCKVLREKAQGRGLGMKFLEKLGLHNLLEIRVTRESIVMVWLCERNGESKASMEKGIRSKILE